MTRRVPGWRIFCSMNAHTHDEAGVEEIVRCLRGAGVLTYDRLAERVAADRWPDGSFKTTLKHAIKSGRVRQLSDNLYEVPESARSTI